MREEVRVKDGCKSKHGGKGARDEGYEANQKTLSNEGGTNALFEPTASRGQLSR